MEGGAPVKSDYAYLESVLPGFTEARDIIKAAGDTVFPLQYKGSKFDFYRFANRFRMAVRFRGITLEDFGDETEAGYSALTRVFFAWSVFERYADLAGDPPPYRTLLSLVPRIEFAKLADNIERHDPDHRLFDFLYEQSLEQNRHPLDRYREGDRRGVVFYAAAIRHIYVHGHLTAHPNKCEAPNIVTKANLGLALAPGDQVHLMAAQGPDPRRRRHQGGHRPHRLRRPRRPRPPRTRRHRRLPDQPGGRRVLLILRHGPASSTPSLASGGSGTWNLWSRNSRFRINVEFQLSKFQFRSMVSR